MRIIGRLDPPAFCVPVTEAAYRAGWSARMEWLPGEPPPELAAECRALWLEGWRDAYDAPLGSGPDIADLMRVGVL
jgi:ribosome modulation factor